MPADLLSFVAPAAGFLLLGGYLFARWYGSPVERALRKAERRDIASFPEGATGRIVGVIEAYEGKILEAPLTARDCVAWAVRVEEHQRGRRSESWEPIARDFGAVSFVVADGTGRALVRAAGSWPSPVMERVGGSGISQDPAPNLEAFLDAHGISSRGMVFNKRLRAEEGILAVGMRVAVLGKARRETELEGLLVIESLDDGSLLMSNASATLR
jgi:hypothetical protein